MRTMLALIAVLALVRAGWAADTDVENPSLRELPIQRGPIAGGKQHQPTQEEINERLHSGGSTAQPAAPAQREELYQRVLEQSRQGLPRSLESRQ